MNKSNEIRKVLSTDQRAPARQVVEKLAKKNIHVSTALVNQVRVKTDWSKYETIGAGTNGKDGGEGHGSEESGDTVRVDYLCATKVFAKNLGGIDRLQKVLDALKEFEAAGAEAE